MGPSLRKDNGARLRKSQSVCADHPQTRFAQLMPQEATVKLHSGRRTRSHLDMRIQLAAIVESVVEDNSSPLNFSRPTEKSPSVRSASRSLDVRHRDSPRLVSDPAMHQLAVRTAPTHFAPISIWRARPTIMEGEQHKSRNFISTIVRLIV